LLGTTVPNALLPLVGSMPFGSVAAALATPSFSIQKFYMELGEDATVNIGSASLKSLKIYYIAAVPAVGDTPAVPQEYGLLGQTTGVNVNADFYIECEERENDEGWFVLLFY
jgi:hypothetical protein